MTAEGCGERPLTGSELLPGGDTGRQVREVIYWCTVFCASSMPQSGTQDGLEAEVRDVS